jgi:predicted nucleic acid-binding protein
MADVARMYGTLLTDANAAWLASIPGPTTAPSPAAATSPARPLALPDADQEALRLVLYGPDSPTRVYAGSVSSQEQQAGELFLVNFAIIEVDASTWDTAAQIWGELARTGKTRRMDADILIAATALRGGYDVVTRNRRDFERIAGVRPRLVVHAW